MFMGRAMTEVDPDLGVVHHPAPLPVELIAFAQNAEDVVLYRSFRDRPPGFYVDVGAGDPTEGSVTKNLVDLLGWRGIDIEPQPILADALRSARPHNSVVQVAVGTGPRARRFYRLVDNWGMSTLDRDIAQRHREAGWTVVEETVEVLALDEILESEAAEHIDLLKVDVEGLETEVLRSVDLERWRPSVILVEATAPAETTKTHERWEPRVLSSGYVQCLFDGLNRFYVRAEDDELGEVLSIPANVFDRFVPLRWWKLLPEESRRAVDPDRKLPD